MTNTLYSVTRRRRVVTHKSDTFYKNVQLLGRFKCVFVIRVWIPFTNTFIIERRQIYLPFAKYAFGQCSGADPSPSVGFGYERTRNVVETSDFETFVVCLLRREIDSDTGKTSINTVCRNSFCEHERTYQTMRVEFVVFFSVFVGCVETRGYANCAARCTMVPNVFRKQLRRHDTSRPCTPTVFYIVKKTKNRNQLIRTFSDIRKNGKKYTLTIYIRL